MKLLFSTLLCAMLSFSTGLEDWVFGAIDATLPKAVSDHTAVRDPATGLIYIAGGCDAENGNVWNAEFRFFGCDSITNAFFEFDPSTNQFKTLASLPQARYRHSSGFADNKVWVVGGRKVDDSLIAEIDVYDVATATWSTIGNLPAAYQVSDHAGFVRNEVYIAGGYDADYNAMATVVKIGLDGTTFEAVAPLNEGRGDILGVASTDGNSAFIAGGFTNLDWCQPLASAEKYDFDTNTWSKLPGGIDARGEIALVESRNHLYALGGEGPLDYEGCNSSTYEISTKTVAVDKIEILLDGENQWKVLESFPEERFRFAAVGIPEADVIYTFGGQIGYDGDCQCFKTTDGVYIYGKNEDVEDQGGDVFAESGARVYLSYGAVAVASVLTALMTLA